MVSRRLKFAVLKELYENRKKAWIIFECIICILIFVVTLRLFYYQITDSEVFPSDTPEHIGFALRGVGYSYLMPAIGIIMNSFGKYGYVAVAIFEALAIITTIYVSKRTIMYCGKISEKPAFVISVSLVFLSSLYIPVLQPLFYKSGIVSQPWHNITYIFMRLFAVLTIAGTWYTLSKYQECLTMKEWGGHCHTVVPFNGCKAKFFNRIFMGSASVFDYRCNSREICSTCFCTVH